MPIFGSNVQTTTVTNSAGAVFNPNAAPFASLAGPLKDVTFENTSSTTTVYLGQSAVTAVTGLALGPGQQVTFQGSSTPAGSGGTAIYAITSSGTAIVVCGLATVNTVD